MKDLSDSQLRRLHELLQEAETWTDDKLPGWKSKLASRGESAELIAWLDLHLSLPKEPQRTFQPGDRIADRYRIVSELGQGGMGIVYRARQDFTDRDVALKVIHPHLASPGLLERFREEIRVQAELAHRSIIRVYDAGVHREARNGRETVFYSMELVEGRHANRYVREAKPGDSRIVRLMARICEAVQHAHDARIIHRDLKPGNILINGSEEPFLLDFGLAKRPVTGTPLSEDALSGLSGTLRYMSPEQLGGSYRGQGQCIDIYALGVIAFELFSGQSPYPVGTKASAAELAHAIQHEPPARLTDLRPELQPRIGQVVGKALRKDPVERHLSAAAFAKALLSCIDSHQEVAIQWTPFPGARVPDTPWTLDRRIGLGGAGEAWLCNHPALPSRVFKFCTTSVHARSLRREASLFRLLTESLGNNAGFVRLYDVSLEDAPYYLAMEHVEGGDLRSWVDRNGGMSHLPLTVRIEIMAQVAEAVYAAHQAGVLHCDIKPGNILIRALDVPESAGTLRVCVSDFGIGRLVLEHGKGWKTQSGFTEINPAMDVGKQGTHLYMAPQLFSGADPSIATDLHSLGVVLFQLVVGDFSKPLAGGWQRHITDPLLLEDIQRCIFDADVEPFRSAGDLAASLRRIEDRRTIRTSQENEKRRLEQRAYLKGVLRTGSVAMVVIGIIAGLGLLALKESRASRMSESKSRINEARALLGSDLVGSRNQGIAVLKNLPNGAGLELDRQILATTLLASSDLLPSTNASWLAQRGSKTGRFLALQKPGGLELRDTVAGHSWFLTYTTNLAPRRLLLSSSRPAVLMFSSDNQLRLATPTKEGGTLMEMKSLGDISSPWAAEFLPDGASLCWGLPDGGLEWLEIGGTKRKTLRAEGQLNPYIPKGRTPSKLAFNSTGRLIAVTSRESHHAQVWDLENEHLIASPYHRAAVAGCLWLDSDTLATACLDGSIYVWRFSGNKRTTLDAPRAVLRCPTPPEHLSLCGTDGLFASLDKNGSGFIWDSRDLLRLKRFSIGAEPAELRATLDGFQALRSDGQVVAWSLQPSPCFREKHLGSRVESLAFSPDGALLVAAAQSRVMVLGKDLNELNSCHVAMASQPGWIQQNDGTTALLVATRDGLRHIPILHTNGELKLGNPQALWTSLQRLGSLAVRSEHWAFAQGDQIHIGNGSSTITTVINAGWRPDQVIVSREGNAVAAVNLELRQARLWSDKSASNFVQVQGVADVGALNERGSEWVLIAENEIRMKRIGASKWVRIDPATDRRGPMLFAADGRRMLIRSGVSDIEIRSGSDWSVENILRTPVPRRIVSMAVSPDGALVATATADQFVQLWRLDELGRQLTALRSN